MELSLYCNSPKNATPLFAQRKPNDLLRPPLDITKINSLIADDYTKNNHPVSTLSDAAKHLGEKFPFCKLDCSRTYHCLQMADQWSAEVCSHIFLLAEQLPTKDLPKVSADLCLFFQVSFVSTWTQSSKLTNVLNTRTTFGIAANNAMDFTLNIRAAFKCNCQTGV